MTGVGKSGALGLGFVLAVAAATAVVSAEEPEAAQGDLSHGRELFELCSQCHGARGEGDAVLEAPPVAGLPSWYVEATLEKFRNGARGAHPDDYSGLRMRPMARTLREDADLAAVASYVASLEAVTPEHTLEGGDAERGKSHYQQVCVTCHGPDAGGNPQLHAPPLTHSPDWYMAEQLRKFKRLIRVSDPSDAWGTQMQGMAMSLADEQAIKDVVAYITTLSNQVSK